MKAEFEPSIEELKYYFSTLSKHRLVEVRKVLTEQFVKRFKKSRIPKYGSINKGFTEQELRQFFSVIDDPKFYLLFSFQAHMGLRIGEALRISIRDIAFETRELRVHTEKANTLDEMLIPVPLFKALLDYVQQNTKKIEGSGGFLFFKEQGKSQNTGAYLDVNYVRNMFKYYREKAGIDEVYDQSDESIYKRKPRMLHRLTTHSLRHYAITHFAQKTNGNVLLTSRFARHKQPSVTMTYIHTNKKELYDGIDGVSVSVDQAIRLKTKLSK